MSTPSLPSRRRFAQHLAGAVACISAAPMLLKGQGTTAGPEKTAADRSPVDTRAYWQQMAEKIAGPVLENLAARTLKANMPVEAQNPNDRRKVTHLEAIGRLLCGIAPWLEQDKPKKWVELSQKAIDSATDPASPDFMNFSEGGQPLVDAAFLAEGLLRAPSVLWEPLPAKVKSNVIACMKATRKIKPYESNWLLFAAMVEAFLFKAGEKIVRERVDKALTKHMEWYKGDGAYGDGADFHWDYYNSFVIQPMLVDVINTFSSEPEWSKLGKDVMIRAQRYAAIQERMIAPDGSFPIMGRSTCYRIGAFHALAQIALMKKLPEPVTPAQVRCGLTAVIRRQMEAPGTFDEKGWLLIGFCGHQPQLAENYISTGSLYLCAMGLLPLGLPASDPFWSQSDELWTNAKAWTGVDIPKDHAIH